MEHLDRLIPLAFLGVIAGFVAYLLFRPARKPQEGPAETRVPAPVAALPLALPIPVAMPVPGSESKVERLKHSSIACGPVAPTAIDTVLELLKKKDTLAAAFLLREILAPPVALRK